MVGNLPRGNVTVIKQPIRQDQKLNFGGKHQKHLEKSGVELSRLL